MLWWSANIDVVWHGVASLRIAFSDGEVSVEARAERVVVTLGGTSHELSRSDASRLADAVGDALHSREEFLRTAGEHRADGAYVVARRGGDSAGNEKVFDSFGRLERLYERLPAEFDAEAVGRTGITGSRRHMVVRHLAEHPAFDCRTVSGNPLVVRKEVTEGPDADASESGEGEEGIAAD